MYKINEIFASVQGEGFWTGRKAIFIRFATCNLKCDFCDTDFSIKKEMSTSEILHEIAKYEINFIVFTGGEPALQVDDILIKSLKKLKYYIAIETNGTIRVPDNIDWITVSPKDAKLRQISGNEFKIVNYKSQDLEKYAKLQFQHFFLQPLEQNGIFNISDTINLIKKTNFKWKLSLQMQKIWNIK